MTNTKEKFIFNSVQDIQKQVSFLVEEGVNKKDALIILELAYLSLITECLLDMVINGIHREG